MATNVILPALGMAQDSGKIVEWLKAEGEHVTQGEPLVVIETDKVVVDLEAPASGILAQVSARAGDEVPVAQVIAVILSSEEIASAAATPAPRAPVATPAQVAPAVANAQVDAPVAVVAARNGRRGASPKARRIATERGLDIATIRGSGPGGVVLAADVLAAPVAAMAKELATRAAPVAVAAHASNGSGESSVSTVWRLMAERTTQSWTSVPHFFLAREVNATRLISWRERAMQRISEKVTYTDLLVKIVAEALRRHPRLNTSWDHGTIADHANVNIGLAVATADGLVVPVIHQADELALRGIVRQRTDLVARAQAGQLRLPDMQEGTFTISNLGMYGIDTFTAIINAPQAAILAVGRIVERVVPVSGQPSVQPMMMLSLSCDHRVVDGARGAQFLASVAHLIEDPSDLTE
ncbi:MAG TPA: dihydrolipoamide acetyltransferase family protein [Ktedonobacterales bacterium]|nr:dihydrolipoamide acetyltransferase family protein [Ktedonobacterales bacterium]